MGFVFSRWRSLGGLLVLLTFVALLVRPPQTPVETTERNGGSRLRRPGWVLPLTLGLGLVLPLVGLLVATVLGAALAALSESEIVLGILELLLGDEIYARVARDGLTHLVTAESAVTVQPWGPGPQLEGALLARTVVAWGTGLVLFGVGFYLTRRLAGRLVDRPFVALVTAVGLVYEVLALATWLHYRLTLSALETMGLAAVATKLGGNQLSSYTAIATLLAWSLPVGLLAVLYGSRVLSALSQGAALTALRSGGPVVAAVVVVWSLPVVGAAAWPGDLAAASTRRPEPSAAEIVGVAWGHAPSYGNSSVEIASSSAEALIAALSDSPLVAEHATLVEIQPPLPTAVVVEVPGSQSIEAPLPEVEPSTTNPVAVRESSTVESVRSGTGFELRRNGQPFVLRGVGYSPIVTAETPDARRRKWQEDFEAIAANGFNTVTGWVDRYHTEYWSGELLDAAQAAGVSVVLPLNLPYELDYSNPAIREAVKSEVATWIERYRDHPALLMWGAGNEVLHHIGIRNSARARAFATFYWELADLIRELDPNHPVTYRCAEEFYIGPLKAAYDETRVERPWFVYGMNVYTSGALALHFRNVLYTKWPRRGWNVPAYVSEFNATGLDERARPAALVRMWRVIRERPGVLVGGSVYVWSTDGPEIIDRAYGLVDGDNEPVDGSMEALRELHARETQ